MKRRQPIRIPSEPLFLIDEMLELLLFYANGDDNLSQRSLTLRLINKKASQMILKFITKCNILGPLNHFISRLPNLTELNLYSTKITKETLLGLTALNSLKLSFSYATPTFLVDLSDRLTTLVINNGKIHITPLHFNKLTKLTSLSLQDNMYFAPFQNYSFVHLTRLELLGYNNIQDGDFIQMTALKSLKIDDNHGIYGKTLHLLSSLTDLSLSNASYIADDTVCQLTGLKSLSIFKNWNITLPTIKSLVNLTSLSWRSSNNKYIDEKELFKALPLLRHFNTNKERMDSDWYILLLFFFYNFSYNSTLSRYLESRDLKKYFQPLRLENEKNSRIS